MQSLQRIAAEVMPSGFYEDFAGQSRLEMQEGNSMLMAFALALIVIYLVLAAQFESFRDPLIIMMSVPLSMFGAIAFLNRPLLDGPRDRLRDGSYRSGRRCASTRRPLALRTADCG